MDVDYVNEAKRMREWLKREMKSRGFDRVVLGLSGGFDSGLSAYIASHNDCLGKNGVYCVLMPCESSVDSRRDAIDLAINLGLQYQIVSFENSYSAVLQDLPFTMSPVCKGNIKARLRMIIVYALANSMNALVLNTSNKSEIFSGNGTKYGDAAGDIALFQNYTKTEMYKLAKAIGFDKVSPEIFNKVPTADLEPNQTDEGTMGVTYAQLDSYLQFLDGNNHILDMDVVTREKIIGLINKSKHKRDKMPSFDPFE